MAQKIKKFSNGMMSFEYTEANRQGEMLFFKIVPGSLKTHYREMKVPSGIVRIGEKEGHEHKITGKEVQLTMFPDATTTLTNEPDDQPSAGVVEIKETGAKVIHPEHDALPLKKGTHVVLTQKEATGRNSSASVRD